MSIRDQIEDSTFLAQHGRYMGALTILLLTVAASSRRTFPKGTMSRKTPDREMFDDEAFTLFLGGRIHNVFGNYGPPAEGGASITVDFRGKSLDVAYILYKFYRCELVHEGKLPEDVEFSVPSKSVDSIGISDRCVRISISAGNKMMIDHGWIGLLQEVVKNAECNGAEFGIKHFNLVSREGLDDMVFLASLVEKYETSLGRVQVLKHAVLNLSPELIAGATNSTLTSNFSALVSSGKIHGGAITGLNSHNFTDRQGALQPRGIELLREIASGYQMIAIS